MGCSYLLFVFLILFVLLEDDKQNSFCPQGFPKSSATDIKRTAKAKGNNIFGSLAVELLTIVAWVLLFSAGLFLLEKTQITEKYPPLTVVAGFTVVGIFFLFLSIKLKLTAQ